MEDANPLSHTEAKASAVNPLARLEASALADNLSSPPLFHNMSMSGQTMFPSKQVIQIPLSSRNNTPIKVCPTSKQSGQLVTSTSIGMNLEVYQNIPLLQKKLQNSFVRNLTMSEGKDSIVKVVLDDSTSNAMKILDVAEQETLHGAEGYSWYESYKVFCTLNDPRINLSELSIANLASISTTILSGGPGTQKDISHGDWPLILNKDSWFHFLITSLAGTARVGAQFKDLPSRGDFPLNTKNASLTISNDLSVPVSQMELVKHLLEQLYTQFNEGDDGNMLQERANKIQNKVLNDFDWRIKGQVGVQCLFLSNYFSKEAPQEIMEHILLKNPHAEILSRMKQIWAQQIEDNTSAEMACIQTEAYHNAISATQKRGIEQAALIANTPLDEHFQREL